MRRVLVTSCGSFALAAQATASVVVYVNDQAGWNAAVGSVTSIGFVDPSTAPDGLMAPDLYGQFGVTLGTTIPELGVYSTTSQNMSFFSDGYGIAAGWPANLAFEFAEPIQAFGYRKYFISWGETAIATFWRDGVLVGQSSSLIQESAGSHFIGYASDFLFDRVELNVSVLDNIHFQTVPAPGVLAVLACASLGLRRRRRRP